MQAVQWCDVPVYIPFWCAPLMHLNANAPARRDAQWASRASLSALTWARSYIFLVIPSHVSFLSVALRVASLSVAAQFDIRFLCIYMYNS